MTHRLEELNRRDRYMIGDLVLKDGKPHKWDEGDYTRSQLGMQVIADMPLTPELLDLNGFGCEPESDREGVHYRYGGWAVDGHKSIIIDINIGTDYMFCSNDVLYVHQFQRVLRACGLHDLADNIIIE